jgi:shikimate kinase
MKITIRYTRKGETTEVSTSLLTVVAWERKFKRKASDMGNGMGIEDIAFLAFEASKQHKVVVPAAFDDFLASLESIEVVSEETENPTPAAPPDED